MTERIKEIKRQIAYGKYETPMRVALTVDRLRDELDPPVVASSSRAIDELTANRVGGSYVM